MSISRDIIIKIKNNNAKLDKPLVVYERDHGLILNFKIQNHNYKYSENNILDSVDDDVLFAYSTLVNPQGYELSRQNGTVIDDVVQFVITEDMTDEISEIGIYQMQIHIVCEHSEFSIPPIEFEVKERLKGDSEGNNDAVGRAAVDISYLQTDEGSFMSEDGTLNIVWRVGDIISSTKLNEMVTYINEHAVQGPKGEKGEQGLQGEKGEKGEQGPAGADGRTPIKGVDYFTANDKAEMLNGYATETFVNNAIANAQLGGDGEVDLSSYATKNYVDSAINDTIDKGLIEVMKDVKKIPSNNDLLEIYNAISIPNDKYILVQRIDNNNYNIFIHFDENIYQRHVFSRDEQYIDTAVNKHPNGDPYANVICVLAELTLRSDCFFDDMRAVGTWTPSIQETYYNAEAGNKLSLDVFGTNIQLSLLNTTNAGKCRVTVDGEDFKMKDIELIDGQCIIDTYHTSGKTLDYTLETELEEGKHEVVITVLGEHNDASAGDRVYFRRLRTISRYTGQAVKSSDALFYNSISYVIPNVVKETAVSVDNVYVGWYHRYCYPESEPIIKIDGNITSMEVGEFIRCKNVDFTQVVNLIEPSTNDVFLKIDTVSAYNHEGIFIRNTATAQKLFNSPSYYPVMIGFHGNRIRFGNGVNDIGIGDDIEKPFDGITNLLVMNDDDQYISYAKILYIDNNVVDNPKKPHFYKHRPSGYFKIYFNNNNEVFDAGYSVTTLVQHSVKKSCNTRLI